MMTEPEEIFLEGPAQRDEKNGRLDKMNTER